MEFKHINDCWKEIEKCSTKKELEDLIKTFPFWSGSWIIMNNEGCCQIINSSCDDHNDEKEDTEIPFRDEDEDWEDFIDDNFEDWLEIPDSCIEQFRASSDYQNIKDRIMCESSKYCCIRHYEEDNYMNNGVAWQVVVNDLIENK